MSTSWLVKVQLLYTIHVGHTYVNFLVGEGSVIIYYTCRSYICQLPGW